MKRGARSKHHYGLKVFIKAILSLAFYATLLFLLLFKQKDFGLNATMACVGVIAAVDKIFDAIKDISFQRSINKAHTRLNKITKPDDGRADGGQILPVPGNAHVTPRILP